LKQVQIKTIIRIKIGPIIKIKMKILVTGGLGFIGSHVVELQNEGFDVIIVDDLSNTSLKVLDGIDGLQEKFRHSKN
jgi:nucleoside-diphosphate-sugar epimerase